MNDYSQQFAEECENQIERLVPFNYEHELIMDPHQQEAIELAAIALAVKEKSFSVVHSCGSGKTVLEGNLAIASQRAKEKLDMQNSQDVILTTQRALIHTIRDELDGLGLDVGVWGGGKVQLDRPLVLANILAVQKSNTRGDLAKKLPLDKIPLVIGDEADLFLTESRKNAVTKFSNAIKIGLTATDTWPDGRDVQELWGQKIHEMRLKEGVLNGVNVPPLFYLFEADLDDAEIQYSSGDYDQKSLQAALKEAEIQKAVPEVYEALVPKKRRSDFPTLVYVPSVNLVYAIEEELKGKFAKDGLRIGSWTGESTTTKQLKEDMDLFNRGELDILVLCEMGARGIDLPRARCLIDAYPTLSSTKLEQRHGRVLRRIRSESQIGKEGFKKSFALIAQIIPRSNKYRPYLLPDLLDCWPDFKEGRLLGLQENYMGGDHGGEVGSPIQKEVNDIRKNLIKKNPNVYVKKVEEINVYEQLTLRENLLQADKDGFFEKDGKRYGTIEAWRRVKNVSTVTLTKRLKGIKGIKGKTSNKRIHDFYDEETIDIICEDLLDESLLQANEHGFIEQDGKIYRTATAWSKIKDTSTIQKRLKGIEGLKGRTSHNRMICNFYDEETIDIICADLLDENIPQANEQGFIEQDGKIYRTLRNIGEIKGVSSRAIKKRLKGIKGIKGKTSQGVIFDFYDEEVVHSLCVELFAEDLPIANDEGFFEKNGKIYRTLNGWSIYLELGKDIIKTRINGMQGVKGKALNGLVYEFYDEETIKSACSDLLDGSIPQANEEGFFIKDDRIYRTIKDWGKHKSIRGGTISKRLEGIKGIKGKIFSGPIVTFYDEEAVDNACADLLDERLPQANKEDFFEKDGKIFRTGFAWSKIKPLNNNIITIRLKGVKGIKGKTYNGVIREFYDEETINSVFEDLLDENLPQENEEGFFEMDGKIYRTITGWSKVKPVSVVPIKKRLRGIPGIKGKSTKGKMYDYYSEELVDSVCADLFDENLPQENEEGFFEKDGKIYRTISGWYRDKNIDRGVLKNRLKGSNGIKGRAKNGLLLIFFDEETINKTCADLLEKRKK